MVKIKGLVLVCIFICMQKISAQTNYKFLIYFTDKNTTTFSLTQPLQFLSQRALDRRERQGITLKQDDLPVPQPYLDSCKFKGALVLYSLKWLNAAVIEADSSELNAILSLPFVHHDKFVRARKGGVNATTESFNYGGSFNQLEMLGANQMHVDGLNGEGMVIAIFDAGFNNADILDVFQSHYQEGRVLSTWDFVENEEDVYDDSNHGTHCFSICGGFKEGALIGPAYKASFHLLTTEDESSETELEELNWAKAAEYADSVGADLISSSLGYNTFDDDVNNHTYADLDGNSTLITQAADKAASKGIIVVNSAGNEGNNSWHYLLAPADGDSVVAVAAVDANRMYATFSSRGPSSDGRIKPDLAAKGQGTTLSEFNNQIITSSGTSYSCPLISGFFASLWQGYRDYSNMELIDIVKQSASQYTTPDNQMGYGIPSYTKAKQMLSSDKFTILPNPGFGDFSLLLPISEVDKTIQLDFFDVLGKKVWDMRLTPFAPIQELGTLKVPAGMYYVRISSDALESSMKLIVGQ